MGTSSIDWGRGAFQPYRENVGERLQYDSM